MTGKGSGKAADARHLPGDPALPASEQAGSDETTTSGCPCNGTIDGTGRPGSGLPEPIPSALHSWRDRVVVGPALAAMTSGVGQFGITAGLALVAKGFGRTFNGHSIAAVAGLSATSLGIGLAIIRLSSLFALPLASLADRTGRRRVILVCTGTGLFLTALAGASPTYWVFVAVFALGRPLLSATTSVAQVIASEETSSQNRAKAIAMVAGGYALGAGAIAVVNGMLGKTIGFRGIFFVAVLPLLALPLIARMIEEPDRFERVRHTGHSQRSSAFRSLAPRYRRRLFVVLALSFAVSWLTGPADTFVFLYAESFQHMPAADTAVMVLAAGIIGLLGLLAGRWLADHLGRRITAMLALVAMTGFAVLLYSGSNVGLVTGYELAIFAGGTFSAPAGTFVLEQFPTSIRAAVSGWQVTSGVIGAAAGLFVFGVVAHVSNHFSTTAELLFPGVAVVSLLFFALRETRGKEPEELWGE